MGNLYYKLYKRHCTFPFYSFALSYFAINFFFPGVYTITWLSTSSFASLSKSMDTFLYDCILYTLKIIIFFRGKIQVIFGGWIVFKLGTSFLLDFLQFTRGLIYCLKYFWTSRTEYMKLSYISVAYGSN